MIDLPGLADEAPSPSIHPLLNDIHDLPAPGVGSITEVRRVLAHIVSQVVDDVLRHLDEVLVRIEKFPSGLNSLGRLLRKPGSDWEESLQRSPAHWDVNMEDIPCPSRDVVSTFPTVILHRLPDMLLPAVDLVRNPRVPLPRRRLASARPTNSSAVTCWVVQVEGKQNQLLRIRLRDNLNGRRGCRSMSRIKGGSEEKWRSANP